MTTTAESNPLRGFESSASDECTPEASLNFAVPKRRWSTLRAVILIPPAVFGFLSLIVLLAVAAAIPILQWATLGYLLEVSRRRSIGATWRETLPGLSLAGRIVWTGLAIALTAIPIWLIANFAYQAEIIQPGSQLAARWRTFGVVIGLLWLLNTIWALMRGGRWRDFFWPAPVRFFREFFRPMTWKRWEDSSWQVFYRLRIGSLLWLGFRAWIATLAWLAIPTALMVAGMQAERQPVFALIGAIGFVTMWLVILYLPILQTNLAATQRWASMFRLRDAHRAFLRSPWWFAIGGAITLLLAIPLYVFRIEELPQELLWLPSILFVIFALPSRVLLGIAAKHALSRSTSAGFFRRNSARLVLFASAPVYLLFLYLASLASWDGPLIILMQHAFLAPVPFAPR